MYKANIEYRANEDIYEDGEQFEAVNVWDETLQAETKAKLRELIEAYTYTKWEDVDKEQRNGYDFATEYSTSYLANGANEGEATPSEIEAWKQGKCRLWAINCHILITKVREKKASL